MAQPSTSTVERLPGDAIASSNHFGAAIRPGYHRPRVPRRVRQVSGAASGPLLSVARMLRARSGRASAMLIAAALVPACSRGAELAPPSTADRPHAAAKGSPPPEKPKARLVVVVVIDQLPSWALARYLPLLEPGGAFRA